MVGKTKPRTAADQARFERLQEFGCLPCRKWAGQWRPVDISHLVSGFKRRGHQATLPECAWHHRGVPDPFDRPSEAERHYGPSRARSPAAYRETFGTDDELLEEINRRIEA
jgi:hypothetical protein